MADGPVWTVCQAVDDAKKCNGGAYYNHAATPTTGTIAKRIGLKVNTSAALQVGPSNLDAFVWNSDLILASFYHSHWVNEETDGTQWCS